MPSIQDDGAFLEVLLELKNATMRQLKVASLGIVRKIDTSNKILKVECFPVLENEEVKQIDVRYLSNNPPSVNEIIVVLFLDKNFVRNLEMMDVANGKDDILKVNDGKLHSEDYAIAIRTF